YVIKISYKRKPPVAVKKADISTCLITLIGTVTGIQTSELAIFNARFGHYIDRFYGIAVIKSGKLGLIAQAVKYLDLIHHFGRQVADCHSGVFPEKILPVYGNLLHI